MVCSAVASLDELAELGAKARRRCSVDDVVIDGHGQIEYVADFELAVDDSWARAHPTHDDLE